MEVIERDIDRDRFMSADEAVTYGIIDKVIQQKSEVEHPKAT
jgi:ATP-dependent Clp protease protease subunit